jgi:hypothetical protein
MPVERSIGCGLARADRGLLEAVAAISYNLYFGSQNVSKRRWALRPPRRMKMWLGGGWTPGFHVANSTVCVAEPPPMYFRGKCQHILRESANP